MYNVAVNAYHSTVIHSLYMYTAADATAAAVTTNTNLLRLVHSLSREKRMMWLNCIILYADKFYISLNSANDDNGGDGERQHVSHFSPHCHIVCCVAFVPQ